ncbi:MAG: hypothetical protein H6925_06995 [Holosporaceae bacterium]|nr:MAG: hypothetical protein H6925_06995 [Holosporaceae bacterium]
MHLMKVPRDNITVAYPYVAQSVEIDSSGLSVAFNLNPKATFHDNTPIRSQDIKFTFEVFKKTGCATLYATFENVKNVVAISPWRVVFILKAR